MPRLRSGSPDLSGWSTRQIWLTAFLAFFALSAAWAVATPLTAAPDEPSHMVKAAATARGQLSGQPSTHVLVINGVLTHQALTKFDVPAEYGILNGKPACYYNESNVTAECAPTMPTWSHTAAVETSAGGSNPLYYAAVGWPSLLNTGEGGLYGMRLASAAICAALLAGAVLTALQWSKRRNWMLLGVGVAATPTALFLNGTVNPNAVEVSGAVLLWISMLAMFTDRNPELLGRRLARAGIASVLLANVRPLGPLWTVGILLCAMLVGEKGALRGLVRNRAVLIWSGVVAASTLAAFAWSVRTSALTAAAVDRPDLTFTKAAAYTFNHSMHYLDSMIGVFGWLDVRSPSETHIAWYAVVGFLAVLALAFSTRREAVALVGVAVSIVVLPMIAQGEQAASLGYIWQGRYLLAVAVGLPLLSVAVLAKHASNAPRSLDGRLTYSILGAILVGGFLAFYNTLHRYANGAKAPFFSWHHRWSPPIGFYTVVVLYLLGAAVLVWLAVVAHRSTDAAQEAGPAVREQADPPPEADVHIPLQATGSASAASIRSADFRPVG